MTTENESELEKRYRELLLDELIVDDIVWEYTTKLTRWKKTKAFMERVTGEPQEDFRLVDIRIRRGIAERLTDPKDAEMKEWFTRTADDLEEKYYGDK